MVLSLVKIQIMMRNFKWIIISLFLLQSFAAAGTPPPGNTLPDLVDKVSDSVVNISSTRFVKQYVLRGMPEFFGMFGIPEERIQKQSSLGSGFLIDSNGYILTNNHVVTSGAEIVVTFKNKKRVPAKIVGRDKLLDLALLQLQGGRTNKGLSQPLLAIVLKSELANPFLRLETRLGFKIR